MKNLKPLPEDFGLTKEEFEEEKKKNDYLFNVIAISALLLFIAINLYAFFVSKVGISSLMVYNFLFFIMGIPSLLTLILIASIFLYGLKSLLFPNVSFNITLVKHSEEYKKYTTALEEYNNNLKLQSNYSQDKNRHPWAREEKIIQYYAKIIEHTANENFIKYPSLYYPSSLLNPYTKEEIKHAINVAQVYNLHNTDEQYAIALNMGLIYLDRFIDDEEANKRNSSKGHVLIRWNKKSFNQFRKKAKELGVPLDDLPKDAS